MPDMMRKKAAPSPTLVPIMALWLREAREEDAALCEIWGGGCDGRTRDVMLKWCGVVVNLVVDARGAIVVVGVFDARWADEEEMRDVRAGDVSEADCGVDVEVGDVIALLSVGVRSVASDGVGSDGSLSKSFCSC
jgi:hypothetical protein